MKHAAKIKLGGKVICIDPCYEKEELGIVVEALPGNYYCYVARTLEGRVASISVRHEEHTDVAINEQYSCSEEEAGIRRSIGVDSGQAGIFNYSAWKDNEPSESDWYNQACTLTLSRLHYGIMEDSSIPWAEAACGLVSSSGYGDGGYPVYVAKVDGNVVGIRIVYIYPDKNEEPFEESIVP